MCRFCKEGHSGAKALVSTGAVMRCVVNMKLVDLTIKEKQKHGTTIFFNKKKSLNLVHCNASRKRFKHTCTPCPVLYCIND
jgi:hypothetical protein